MYQLHSNRTHFFGRLPLSLYTSKVIFRWSLQQNAIYDKTLPRSKPSTLQGTIGDLVHKSNITTYIDVV